MEHYFLQFLSSGARVKCNVKTRKGFGGSSLFPRILRRGKPNAVTKVAGQEQTWPAPVDSRMELPKKFGEVALLAKPPRSRRRRYCLAPHRPCKSRPPWPGACCFS